MKMRREVYDKYLPMPIPPDIPPIEAPPEMLFIILLSVLNASGLFCRLAASEAKLLKSPIPVTAHQEVCLMQDTKAFSKYA